VLKNCKNLKKIDIDFEEITNICEEDELRKSTIINEIKTKLKDLELIFKEEDQQSLKRLKVDLRDFQEEFFKLEDQTNITKSIIEKGKTKVLELEGELQELRNRCGVIQGNKIKSLREITYICEAKEQLLRKLKNGISCSEIDLDIFNIRLVRIKTSMEEKQVAIDNIGRNILEGEGKQWQM